MARDSNRLRVELLVVIVLVAALKGMAVQQTMPPSTSPSTRPLIQAAPSTLKYTFKGNQSPVYRLTIRTTYPTVIETTSGTISYSIKSVDPENGQIQLDYSKHLQTSRQTQGQQNQQNGWPPHPMAPPPMPPMPPFPSPWAQQPAPTDIAIDAHGQLVRSNRTGEDRQLPELLGTDWQLLIPPLPTDGKPSWMFDVPIILYTKKNQPQNHWPPAPPWQQQQPEERIDRPSHQETDYGLQEIKADQVTISHGVDIRTDEKVGDSPLECCIGTGTIVFDTSAGLVRSLSFDQLRVVNVGNVIVKVPTTVTAQLLSADEVAKMKAEQAAALAKMRTEQDQQKAQQTADAQRSMPTAEQTAVETKSITENWKPATAAPLEVLPAMHGECTHQSDGTVMLSRGQRITTAESYQVPTTIRAIILVQQKDTRLSYAADQVIFNWEMNQSELRIDGGPANGQHKPGAGRLPMKVWIGIEWVVHPDEMVLYINGQERYRATGDFTSIDKPFSIEAHGGPVAVKSVQVIH